MERPHVGRQTNLNGRIKTMTTPEIPTKSIAAVLNYLENSERSHWESEGQPTDHIYTHVMRVREWFQLHERVGAL